MTDDTDTIELDEDEYIERTIEIEGACSCDTDDSDIDAHSTSCALWEVDGWALGLVVWYDGECWDAEELWGWGAEESQLVDHAAADVPGLEDHGWSTPDDEKYECTCYLPEDETVTFTTQHDKNCSLYLHAAWKEMCCEWDHPTRTFIYVSNPAEMHEPGKLTPPAVAKCVCKPEALTWCGKCRVFRDSPQSEWEFAGKPTYPNWEGSTSYASGVSGYTPCRHYDVELEFPNGVKIYPSSKRYRKDGDDVPDHALYLDDSWVPSSVATFLPWRDYGLPRVPYHRAAEAIIDSYTLAYAGQSVEVGCIGGHGRTGTVLACMAVLAGVPALEAVDWVQDNYCHKAVETADQRWFVLWFNGYVNSVDVPPAPPVPPPAKKWAPTSSAGGKKDEVKKGGGKLLWDEDKKMKVHQDLTISDLCPICGGGLHSVKTAAYTGLSCNDKKCDAWHNLPRCPLCDVYLDAHNLFGYACWNPQCKAYNTMRYEKDKLAQLYAAGKAIVAKLGTGAKTSN